MTVFGPATESATYVLLAPSLVMLTARAKGPLNSRLTCKLAWTSYAVFLLLLAADWFPWGRSLHNLGIQPIAGLLFLGATLSSAWRRPGAEFERTDAQPLLAARAA